MRFAPEVRDGRGLLPVPPGTGRFGERRRRIADRPLHGRRHPRDVLAPLHLGEIRDRRGTRGPSPANGRDVHPVCGASPGSTRFDRRPRLTRLRPGLTLHGSTGSGAGTGTKRSPCPSRTTERMAEENGISGKSRRALRPLRDRQRVPPMRAERGMARAGPLQDSVRGHRRLAGRSVGRNGILADEDDAESMPERAAQGLQAGRRGIPSQGWNTRSRAPEGRVRIRNIGAGSTSSARARISFVAFWGSSTLTGTGSCSRTTGKSLSMFDSNVRGKKMADRKEEDPRRAPQPEEIPDQPRGTHGVSCNRRGLSRIRSACLHRRRSVPTSYL